MDTSAASGFSARDYIYVGVAIVALATFVWRIWDASRRYRSEETRAWQEVVVQKYLAKAGKSCATLDSILSHYRSEASARPQQLKRSHLSENELRRILISLNRKLVIRQLAGDTYALHIDSQMASLMIDEMVPSILSSIGVQGMMMSDLSIKKAVYTILGNAPFTHSVSDLAVKVVEETDIKSTQDVRSFITQEVARQRLRIDSQGRIGFGSSATIEE